MVCELKVEDLVFKMVNQGSTDTRSCLPSTSYQAHLLKPRPGRPFRRMYHAGIRRYILRKPRHPVSDEMKRTGSMNVPGSHIVPDPGKGGYNFFHSCCMYWGLPG